MLLEELHLLEVLPLLVARVFLLELLDLRLELLHLLHALHRLVLQGEGQQLHRDGEQDDGDAPVVRRHHAVEELHHREQHVGDHRPEAQIDRVLQDRRDCPQLVGVLRARVDDERIGHRPASGDGDGHGERRLERPVRLRLEMADGSRPWGRYHRADEVLLVDAREGGRAGPVPGRVLVAHRDALGRLASRLADRTGRIVGMAGEESARGRLAVAGREGDQLARDGGIRPELDRQIHAIEPGIHRERLEYGHPSHHRPEDRGTLVVPHELVRRVGRDEVGASAVAQDGGEGQRDAGLRVDEVHLGHLGRTALAALELLALELHRPERRAVGGDHHVQLLRVERRGARRRAWRGGSTWNAAGRRGGAAGRRS